MNLLITGAWQDAEEHIGEIEKCGHRVCFLQFESDELPCDYDWVEGIIGNGIFMTHSIEKFKRLKYVQLTSAGFDRVPMDYVKEHGIVINNARGVYSNPMAEYAVAGVLSLYRCHDFFMENQKKHKWEKRRDLRELDAQKICILGCGSVGTECAKRFKIFGCQIIGVDMPGQHNDSFDIIFPINKIKNAVSKADVLIITLPLTHETYHLVNSELFAAMKTEAIVVNIARGALVDTNALIVALRDKLGGAVIDVFEEEPLRDDSPLWDMKNVIITPHNSFVGNNNNRRMNNKVMEFIDYLTKGEQK